jgi:hypothetical protein
MAACWHPAFAGMENPLNVISVFLTGEISGRKVLMP